MITTAIISILSVPLIGLFSLLPNVNTTALSNMDVLLDNYIKPMFSFMKVWIPMNTFWFWVSLTLGLHLSIILFKLVLKIASMFSGGLVNADKL